jgi:PAS domain S-box-containing protein
MPPIAFWFQSAQSWPAVMLAVAAASLLGTTALIVVQLRRQVHAAWAETGRIYQRASVRLEAVGDLLEGVLFETDAARTLTYTNQAFHALTGFRERDLRSGLSLHDLFEPEDRRHLLQELEVAPDIQEVRVRRFHLRRRDGAAVPVSLRLSAITERERLVGWRGLLAPLPEAGGGEPRAVEKVLADILRDVNQSPRAQHEAVLRRGLEAIGRLLGADRCYLYRTSGDGESLVSLHQWYATGVSPMTGDERLPGLASYPWTLTRLREDGALAVAEVQDLDATAVPERQRWLHLGITSLLAVPMSRGREIVGLVGCETLGRVRHWGPRDLQLLEAMAEICQRIVAVEAGESEEERLRARLERLERTVTRQQAELEQASRQLARLQAPAPPPGEADASDRSAAAET